MVLPDNLCSHFFCSCVCVFVSLSIISTSWGQCFVALEPHSVCVPLQMEMVGRVWGYYQAPGSKAAFIAFLWASRKWRERASYRSVSPQIIGMSRLIIDDIPLNCSWNLWIVLFNMVLEKSYHDPVNRQFETYYFIEQEILWSQLLHLTFTLSLMKRLSMRAFDDRRSKADNKKWWFFLLLDIWTSVGSKS